MAQLNPIVYVPPTLLLLAILGIGIYTYHDRIQDLWLETVYRLQNYRRQENDEGNDRLTEEQIRELYGDVNGDIPEELLREFAEEDENDDDDDDDEDEDEDGEDEGEEKQGEVQPQGSTTSARLRMHHEMVQQMRARAGFAPEPFPGDVVLGEEGAAEGEQVEDDGGVGSSQGATAATGTPKFKRIGKKKAEKLERKNQMRAYHEFMEMQRNERRQQEEMFRIHDAAQQEERQRKRIAQLEKERKRKEQLKEKEVREMDSKRKRLQAEKIKEEDTRRELRAYIQRVKSFKLAALAKRLDRTEAQLLKDLLAIAQDNNDPDVLISLANTPSIAPSSPSMSTGAAAASSSSSVSPARQHLLVLFDSESDQYVILDKAKLTAFAAVVQSKGRVDKKELSVASQDILCSPQPIN
ncbi:hypothetical protein BGW39_006144 [Mortierella sp. 14UC]|nr:hypothetical protein BGW39_006144 [Mortierella sp. 14UC]